MSKVRPGFKLTEVGVIPEEWSCSDLRSLGQVVRGGSPRPAGDPRYFNGSFRPWLTVASLTGLPSSQLYVRRTATALTEAGAKRSRELRNGTFILANSGFSLGIAKILDIDCCANDGIAAVIGLNERVYPPFLASFINSITDYLRETVAIGNDQPNLNTDRIGRIYVPIPPLPEQQAAAEALADADALIEGLEALIAKKRDIKQGAMQELLNGQQRGKPARLGSVLQVGHGRSQKAVEVSDGPYPILASGGKIGTANDFLYDKPSVLIGRKGTIDRPQYADKPFWTIDTLFYTVIAEPNDPKYLFYRFCMINWRQYNEASGVPSLSASTIENIEIEIHLPKEQRSIAKVLTDMDAEIVALEDTLAKARAVKQGMMQVLLTGKIRLK